MSENTPVISKAKSAIDDHLDWARVHLSELEDVKGEISNTDFHERCNDIFRELIATPQHFTILFRIKRATLADRTNNSVLRFEQLTPDMIKDPDFKQWVIDRLSEVERITKTTVDLIHGRDGIELKPELRRRFPTDWLERRIPRSGTLFVPGRTLQVGSQFKIQDSLG